MAVTAAAGSFLTSCKHKGPSFEDVASCTHVWLPDQLQVLLLFDAPRLYSASWHVPDLCEDAPNLSLADSFNRCCDAGAFYFSRSSAAGVCLATPSVARPEHACGCVDNPWLRVAHQPEQSASMSELTNRALSCRPCFRRFQHPSPIAAPSHCSGRDELIRNFCHLSRLMQHASLVRSG